MAGVFRFSNAVSDISKFIETYRLVYKHFIKDSKAGKFFGHEEAKEFLAMNGLASSLGAVGKEAVRRSTREDKSRDPLYNQHKSYSEIFRMLGWYEPGSKQTNFRLSEYGQYIFETKDKELLKKLFGLNVLHIVGPNPLTTVKSGNILRPFPHLLKLMTKLDNVISRDEIILGVLACGNDTEEFCLDEISERILKMRNTKKSETLDNAILKLREKHGLGSAETLGNYTRFPIASLKWMGWAEGISLKDIYEKEKKLKVLRLTDEGVSIANKLSEIPDVRMEMLGSFTIEEKGAFVAYSNLHHLSKCGYDLGEYKNTLPELRKKCSGILGRFNIQKDFLFFGYQEAPRDLLRKADEILEKML